MPDVPLLEIRAVDKSFGGVHAVDHVSMTVRAGEIHALLGENGAGKSTLVRILCGAVEADSGEVLLDGRPVRLRSPRDAERAGIAMIHQELSLCLNIPVAANIFLGRELRGGLGFVSTARMNAAARECLRKLDLDIDVRRPTEEYNLATQQMIEVGKALLLDARVLIMDEPTSALTEGETKQLFRVIRSLRERGVAIIYISHKLEEIYELADTVTVMRDSKWIGTSPTSELPQDKMIEWMVGRKIETLFPERHAATGGEVLRVRDITLPADDGTERLLVDHVSLAVRAGEIVGLGGLRGCGNSEFLGCLFGQYEGRPSGEIVVRGDGAEIRRPSDALAQRIALLTNDRKTTGLVLSMSVLGNMTLASLPRTGPVGLTLPRYEETLARPYRERMAVKTASWSTEVSHLSGGNQQKVALAKWLMTEPDVLLLDEPTRGVDVGAKADIYHLMNELAAAGKGILLITSELPELVNMSDRILVFHRGRITRELTGDDRTPERVMAAAMGEE